MSKGKTFVGKKLEDCVPNYHQPKYQYINGYYDAGRKLVEEALKLEKDGKSHNYFYPICYSYRHYIELHLKTIIEDLELLYEKSKILGYLKNGVLLDENKDVFSPILALNTIFDKFQNQKIFIITVDTPFVSIESISKLIDESKDVDICVAQTEKIHNLCGVFSSNISLAIKNMIENNIHKIGYLIKNNKFKILEFPNDSEFININNQNDYEKALSYIRINNNYNN